MDNYCGYKIKQSSIEEKQQTAPQDKWPRVYLDM